MARYLPAILVLSIVAATPSSGDPCTINFVSHGVFRVVVTPEGDCLKFVDALGVSWEITNPRGAWTDGVTGTIFAEFLAPGTGTCTQAVGDPLRICSFDSDVTRNIVGTLDFLTPFETNCPGFSVLDELRQAVRIPTPLGGSRTVNLPSIPGGRRLSARRENSFPSTSLGRPDGCLTPFSE